MYTAASVLLFMPASRAAAHAVSQTMCRCSREGADTVLQGDRVCARTTAVLDFTDTIVLLLGRWCCSYDEPVSRTHLQVLLTTGLDEAAVKALRDGPEI